MGVVPDGWLQCNTGVAKRDCPTVLDLRTPHQIPQLPATAERRYGEPTMQGVKSAIVVTAILAATALGACRSEVPTPPLKLGVDVPAAQKVVL